METLQVSAQLHDVGKIGIEDHILKKPGALTEEEFEVMKTHTTKGANILRPVTQLAEMLPGIELHHEALDGRGYPYGLQGDQIPLAGARDRRGRHLRRADHQSSVSAGAHARTGAADHQESRGQAPRSNGSRGSACGLRTRRHQDSALHHQAPHRATANRGSRNHRSSRREYIRSHRDCSSGKNVNLKTTLLLEVLDKESTPLNSESPLDTRRRSFRARDRFSGLDPVRGHSR